MAMLTSVRPHSFKTVRRDLDNWFDQFFGSADNSNVNAWSAPTSMWEDDGHVYLEIEMPGVGQDDIGITFEKGVLNITAQRKSPEEERNYWHQTRSYGKTELHARLPETVDGETVDAELNNGVLTVKLAKTPEAQPRKITVKTGG